MEWKYVYPDVGGRTGPREWVERGSTNMISHARDPLKPSSYRTHTDPAIDGQIREQFDIKLPRS